MSVYASDSYKYTANKRHQRKPFREVVESRRNDQGGSEPPYYLASRSWLHVHKSSPRNSSQGLVREQQRIRYQHEDHSRLVLIRRARTLPRAEPPNPSQAMGMFFLLSERPPFSLSSTGLSVIRATGGKRRLLGLETIVSSRDLAGQSRLLLRSLAPEAGPDSQSGN